MSKYLMATLIGGGTVVAEFSRLRGSGERYSAQVFARAKAFNAWHVVQGVHPASGESVLVRTREMISGERIHSIRQVKPKAGIVEHGYDPDNFEPVLEVQNGQFGGWVAPEKDTPTGAVAGMKYPVHRDPDSLRRYVVLRVATEAEAEVRHYVDTEAGPDASLASMGPVDSDEDDEEAY